MPNKMYLYLLIICVIWSQGINGIIGEEIRESSNILFRQKRVLNYVPGEDHTVSINSYPYLVKVKLNLRIVCVGSILSHIIVITSAICVPSIDVTRYNVVAGSARIDHGTTYNVRDIKKHYGNHPYRPTDGISLLTTDEAFVFGQFINFIELHSGPLLPGTSGVITGWGYNFRNGNNGHGTCHARGLRAIKVPIIAHQECVNRYRAYIAISDRDICTYHEQKHCGHNDGGAPLVVGGQLVGVHLWTGPDRTQNNPEYPDVFAFVQDAEYKQWILSHI